MNPETSVMGYSSSRANLSNPREGYASLGVRALGLEQQQTLMPLPLGVAVPLMRVSLGRGEERATNKTNPLRNFVAHPLTAGRRFGKLRGACGQAVAERRSVAARAGADGRNPKDLSI